MFDYPLQLSDSSSDAFRVIYISGYHSNTINFKLGVIRSQSLNFCVLVVKTLVAKSRGLNPTGRKS